MRMEVAVVLVPSDLVDDVGAGVLEALGEDAATGSELPFSLSREGEFDVGDQLVELRDEADTVLDRDALDRERGIALEGRRVGTHDSLIESLGDGSFGDIEVSGKGDRMHRRLDFIGIGVGRGIGAHLERAVRYEAEGEGDVGDGE